MKELNNERMKRIKSVTVVFIFIIGITVIQGCEESKPKKLPIAGFRDYVERTVNGKTVTDTIFHTIPEFKLLNQDSIYVTQSDFDDHIYIADFFFTTCPDICPIMSGNMLKVYEAFKDEPMIKFISHSIDPYNDTVPVLKEYATKLGVGNQQKWQFVTGSQEEMFVLAQKGYMATAKADPTLPSGVLHNGAFVLVDKQKRVRGLYDGTDSEKVEKLLKDIPKLLEEYNSNK